MTVHTPHMEPKAPLSKPGPCAFCVVDECGHVCTGACDKQPTRTEFEASGGIPLSEGALMAVYIEFDRHADKTLSSADYLLGFAAAVSKATAGKISAHAAQTEREPFEAAAYRRLRDKLLAGDCFDLSDFCPPGNKWRGIDYPSTDELDTAIAAAMGWPTVPEVKS